MVGGFIIIGIIGLLGKMLIKDLMVVVLVLLGEVVVLFGLFNNELGYLWMVLCVMWCIDYLILEMVVCYYGNIVVFVEIVFLLIGVVFNVGIVYLGEFGFCEVIV